ncbi:MAG: DUF2202 domain-containing protein [Candidatus Izemoplasmatales bacterium]|nr:DUF2202 domain-containing protein [Candidatus Izemoplasmatales bacterium]
MKKTFTKVLVFTAMVFTALTAFTLTGVSADALYTDVIAETGSAAAITDESLTLEDMLVYALQDEYTAQAEYAAIIAAYGETRPFINIVAAEQTHIDLLLPLFAAYGIDVPANTASDNVILPDSLTSAIATGIQAEEMNIAMYQLFLNSPDLPDDVRNVFTYLLQASENHLNAFQKDRYYGLGTDIANMFQKQFKTASKTSYKDSTTAPRFQSLQEDCPNFVG